MTTLFFCPSTEPVFEVIIIGRNKPRAYKRIITREAIIKALTALIFIKINHHLFSYRTNEVSRLLLKQKFLRDKELLKKTKIGNTNQISI